MRLILLIGFLALVFTNAESQPLQVDSIEQIDSVMLNEVIVTSSINLGSQNTVNFYRANNFSSIDDINARVGGMNLIKRGAYALEPQLGGFSAGQLNITIDGMKIFGACTDKMDPVTSYVEPSNLKSIEVKQGTSSCESGCNIGGSVDMALQEPQFNQLKPFYISAGVGYESVSNGRNFLLSSGFSAKKWAIGINGVYRKNDLYTDGEGEKVPYSQFEKTNFSVSVVNQIDTINSLKADVLFDLAQNVGYPALPMDVSKAQAVLFALQYQRIKNTNLLFKLYYNDIVHIMDDSHRDSTYYLNDADAGNTDTVLMRMDMPGYSSTLGAYLEYALNLNQKNKMMFRVDNYTNRALAEMTMYMHFLGAPPEAPMYMQTWPEMIRNVAGIYVQYSVFITNKFLLLLNGRVDYALDIQQNELAKQQFSVLGYDLPGSISNIPVAANAILKYNLSGQIVLSSTLGFSERLPTITERYGYYLYNAYDGYDYIGNPFIKMEKSVFFEIMATYTSRKVNISLVQNFSHIYDYIMGQTDTTLQQMNFYANGIRVYQNFPDAYILSTNLEAYYTPIKPLTIFFQAKYSYGSLGPNEPLPLIAPFKSILAVNYQKGRWAIQVENESAIAQNRINEYYGETPTPSFTVFNMKANYVMPLGKTNLDMAVGLRNIFNEVYYEHLDWGGILRPGRSVNLSVIFSY